MASLISLGFYYRETEFYALISVKNVNGIDQYRITIMNGELEKYLSNCNVINQLDSQLQLDDCDGDKEKYYLKKQIVQELGKYLNKEIIETNTHNIKNHSSSAI